MLLVQKPCIENHQIKMYCNIPKSHLCSIFSKFQGAISTHEHHKTSPNPEDLALSQCPWRSSFFPSTLFPSNQGLPVIRTLRGESWWGRIISFVAPSLSLVPVPSRQPDSTPGPFASGSIYPVGRPPKQAWLSSRILSTLMGLCIGGRGQCPGEATCRRETSTQRQGFRAKASRGTEGGGAPGITAPSLNRSTLLSYELRSSRCPPPRDHVDMVSEGHRKDHSGLKAP